MRIFFTFILIIFCSGSVTAGDTGRYWIYFVDKPHHANLVPAQSRNYLITDRAIHRRQIRGLSSTPDQTDWPIDSGYISQLRNMGVRVHRESRWLNAVSCWLDGVDPGVLTRLPFVKNVVPVNAYARRNEVGSQSNLLIKADDLDYGGAFHQNDMLGIPDFHRAGYTGEGVLIAIFDTGFILEHEAVKNVHVVDQWDFVDDDGIVSNEPGDLFNQHNHGTEVLAVMAGNFPGKLIGPAYNSHFLLAKTEDLRSETHTEEDNWVAAAEWAERAGADIISTSVGYLLDYSYEDMNGNTAVITKAADLAVKKGVAVFSSAGNEGASAWNYVTAPADGDSVIAVGGVRSDRTRWSGSSIGPTADGRIKPDLMAQAQNVYTVIPGTIDGYTGMTGTSYSCPLAAGSGAMLLSAMPFLSPVALRDTLQRYASRSDTPDNYYGFGLINLVAILQKVINKPGVIARNFTVRAEAGRNILSWLAEREVNNDSWEIWRKVPAQVLCKIGEVLGRDDGRSTLAYTFTDLDVSGGENFSYVLGYVLTTGETRLVDSVAIGSIQPEDNILLKNFPNPFNRETHITFGLIGESKISLQIIGISGKIVKNLVRQTMYTEGFHHLSWNGENESGQQVASGNYFLVLSTSESRYMHKILYLK